MIWYTGEGCAVGVAARKHRNEVQIEVDRTGFQRVQHVRPKQVLAGRRASVAAVHVDKPPDGGGTWGRGSYENLCILQNVGVKTKRAFKSQGRRKSNETTAKTHQQRLRGKANSIGSV